MGAGYHGGFGKTSGAIRFAVGDIEFQSEASMKFYKRICCKFAR